MRLLEFESKEILSRYQIPTPSGNLISKSGPLVIKGPVMLKSQIPVGGRGKSGGILEAFASNDAKAHIEHLLSTSVRGYKAVKILMEEKMQVKQEFFMAVTYDTITKAPVAIFSSEGGMDIEALATHQPGKVHREVFSVQSKCIYRR